MGGWSRLARETRDERRELSLVPDCSPPPDSLLSREANNDELGPQIIESFQPLFDKVNAVEVYDVVFDGKNYVPCPINIPGKDGKITDLTSAMDSFFMSFVAPEEDNGDFRQGGDAQLKKLLKNAATKEDVIAVGRALDKIMAEVRRETLTRARLFTPPPTLCRLAR